MLKEAGYIKREEMIDALQNHYEVRNTAQNAIMDECVMIAMRVPAADVVEVVRCKDCASYLAPPNNLGRDGICSSLNQYCPGWFFCANGNRKTR